MTMLSEGEATVLAMRLAESAHSMSGNPDIDSVAKLFLARAEQLIGAFEPAIKADPPKEDQK